MLFLPVLIAIVTAASLPKQPLIDGIKAHLLIQDHEMISITKLQSYLPQVMAQDGAQQYRNQLNKLKKELAEGISVREHNQVLAKQYNSPSLAGLNKVQLAQENVSKQVQRLARAGPENWSKDADLLTLMGQEFKRGSDQNKANLAAV